MATVSTSVEAARGCGYRQEGGIYIVAPALAEACSLLPVPLHVCPTCGAGIKQTRGWTWVDADQLLPVGPHPPKAHQARCPLAAPGRMGERQGLMWIGAEYYTVAEYIQEAATMGISRRMPKAVPRGLLKEGSFVPTWVLVAHPHAIPPQATTCEHGNPVGEVCADGCPRWEAVPTDKPQPGIISCFLARALEYIVREDDDEEFLDGLEERGLSLVRVVREGQGVEEEVEA